MTAEYRQQLNETPTEDLERQAAANGLQVEATDPEIRRRQLIEVLLLAARNELPDEGQRAGAL